MFSPLLLAALLLPQAEAPADEALRLEVRRLVRQLDAPQLAQRDAAEESLLKLGPKVLDLLPPVNDRTPAEVVQRTGRIRQKLQRAMADAAAQSSQVTLQADAMPLSKIFAAIQEQTGNKIVDDRGRFGGQVPDPDLKVSFDKTPFWQALDRVLDQARLTIYPFAQEKAIHVIVLPEGHAPRAARASYTGPFRIEPVRVSAERDLRNPASQSLGLTLEIAWEPRLAPISLQQRMADVSAADENGNPLAIESRDAELEVPVEPDAMAKELKIPLGLPPREVRQIARLQGSLLALLPGKIETFRFKDLEQAKKVEQRVAGVTVTLDEVRKNNKSWEVRMGVRFDEALGALQSHRNWIYENEAYLEGPDGKPVKYGIFETIRQLKKEVGLAYFFRTDRPLADYTFVYKTPGVILSAPFKYEIRSVKLP